MENIPNQPINLSGIPSELQSTPSDPLCHEKGIFPIIVGVLVLLVVVGSTAYYLGTKHSDATTQEQQTNAPVNQTTPTQTIVVSSPTPSVITWKTQTIESKRIPPGDNEAITLYVDFQIPSTWAMKAVKKDANCTDYVITSDAQTTVMTLQPLCGGWTATYSKWPQDGVVVAEQADASDDGSTNYRIRYFDTQKRQFKYVDALATPPLDKSATQIMDAVTITHQPYTAHTFVTAFIKVDYSDNESEKEQVLTITDQIAASMRLR